MLLPGIMASGMALLLAPAGHAQEPKDRIERPERGIAMYTEYSRITIPLGDKVRMTLTIDNKGKRDENVLVNLVSVPRGWKTEVKGAEYDVSGVSMEATKTRTLTSSSTSRPWGLTPMAPSGCWR
jgi:hypothetical protein